MKQSIFSNLGCQRTVNATQLQEFAKFLLLNRSLIASPQEIKTLLTSRSLTITPLSTLFSRIVELQKDKVFTFIKIPKELPTPEVMTTAWVPFDVRQMKPVEEHVWKILSGMPEYSDKIIVNATQLFQRSGEQVDISNFQGYILRNALSRSYFSTQGLWLNPGILQYLAKVYSMAVAMAATNAYNLSYPEQLTVQAIFAFFFLQQCMSTDEAEAIMRSSRELNLGNSIELNSVFAIMQDTLGHQYYEMTLDDACACVANLGIPRIRLINRVFLYSRTQRLGPDNQTSMIALDYPPYFAYIMLLVASGRKNNGLANIMKNGNLLNKAKATFEELSRLPTFFSSLS